MSIRFFAAALLALSAFCVSPQLAIADDAGVVLVESSDRDLLPLVASPAPVEAAPVAALSLQPTAPAAPVAPLWVTLLLGLFGILSEVIGGSKSKYNAVYQVIADVGLSVLAGAGKLLRGRYGMSLLLLGALALASCAHTDPVVVADVSTVATVQTVDDGWAQYVEVANVADAKIADQVIADCKHAVSYQSCAAADAAKLRAAWDKADLGLATYRDAVKGGGAALGQKWSSVLAASVQLLKDVGIYVVVATGGAK